MGHNNVISGHPKSIGILQLDELSTGPPDLECHNQFSSSWGKKQRTSTSRGFQGQGQGQVRASSQTGQMT